ncbi:MAG: sulfatase [Planctomycetota bacterium]
MTTPNPVPAQRCAPAAVALCQLTVLALVASCSGGGDEPKPRRDVVLVTVDTLRQDYTSLGNSRYDTTPFLAELTAHGTVFENAFSMSSWTSPSMNMILTGEARIENDGAVLADQEHLAEVFQRNGYDTAGFIGNPILFEENGFSRGCDVYDMVAVEKAHVVTAHDHVAKGLAWLDGLEAARAQDAGAERDPFFLWIHPMDPHDPYEQHPDMGIALAEEPGALDVARGTLSEKHAAMLTDAEWATLEELRTRYAGEVRQVDDALRVLWAGLEERGLADGVVFVLASDHGEGLWMRPPLKGEAQSRHPFPPLYMTHGIQLYSEQIHVPLVFVGPGVDAGRREARFVDTLDLAPTLLNLVGLRSQHVMDGTPLLGPGGAVPGGPVFALCNRVHSVTVDERWRLHVPSEYRAGKFGDVPLLYDLDADPDERSPVDDPERAATLAALLEDWKEEHKRVNAYPEGSIAYYKALRALGYGGETSNSKRMDQFLEDLEDEGLLPEDGSMPGAEEVRALEERRGDEGGDGT